MQPHVPFWGDVLFWGHREPPKAVGWHDTSKSVCETRPVSLGWVEVEAEARLVQSLGEGAVGWSQECGCKCANGSLEEGASCFLRLQVSLGSGHIPAPLSVRTLVTALGLHHSPGSHPHLLG